MNEHSAQKPLSSDEPAVMLAVERLRHKWNLTSKILDASGNYRQAWVDDIVTVADAFLKAVGSPPFVCKAALTATDPPTDCDWPVCGCDPYAEKVVQSLEESGKLKDGKEIQEQAARIAELTAANEKLTAERGALITYKEACIYWWMKYHEAIGSKVKASDAGCDNCVKRLEELVTDELTAAQAALAKAEQERDRATAARKDERCPRCDVDGYWFFATKIAEQRAERAEAQAAAAKGTVQP